MATPSATYEQLQEILKKPGCPICGLGLRAGHSYLDSLLWESVNDPGIRDRLAESLGFCGRHSRELLTLSGERLGVAILQRAVLQEAVSRLQHSPAPTQVSLVQRIQDHLGGPERIPTGMSAEASLPPCPACVQQEQMETRALETLLKQLVGDLEKPLATAGGLCRPHLQQALQGTNDAQVHGLLIDLHRRVWEEVIAHLSEFIRKRDHRFHDEKITEPERVAIERSIAILTGEYPRR